MSGCCGGNDGLKTLALTVKGMSCEHCRKTIEKTVWGIDGIKEVDVNLEKGLLKVTFDPERARITDIRRAVTDAGYEVLEHCGDQAG